MFHTNQFANKPDTNVNKKYRQPVNRFMQDRVSDVLKIHKNRSILPMEFLRTLSYYRVLVVFLSVNRQRDLKKEEF